jgi:hypothetical protein
VGLFFYSGFGTIIYMNSMQNVGKKSNTFLLFNKKQILIAIIIFLLSAWAVKQLRQNINGWGDPAPVAVHETLQLPFGVTTDVMIHKMYVDARYGVVYTQKQLWSYILAPYWFGFRVVVVYLCAVSLFHYVIRKFRSSAQ